MEKIMPEPSRKVKENLNKEPPDPTPEDWEIYDRGKQRIRKIYPQPEAERRVEQLIELLKL